MHAHMTTKLKWTHRELHDALIIAGLGVPSRPSLLNYFSALHAQFGDTEIGFLPQSFQTHTKVKMKELLKCLGRTGLKVGGRFTDKKVVLAERLAFLDEPGHGGGARGHSR